MDQAAVDQALINAEVAEARAVEVCAAAERHVVAARELARLSGRALESAAEVLASLRGSLPEV